MWPNLFDGKSCSFQMENSLEFLLLIFSILHMCQLFLPFTYKFLVTSKWMSGNIPQKKKLPRYFQVLQGKKKKTVLKLRDQHRDAFIFIHWAPNRLKLRPRQSLIPGYSQKPFMHFSQTFAVLHQFEEHTPAPCVDQYLRHYSIKMAAPFDTKIDLSEAGQTLQS